MSRLFPQMTFRSSTEAELRGAVPAQPSETADHDHAWRRIATESGTRSAEYRCDLCAISYTA